MTRRDARRLAWNWLHAASHAKPRASARAGGIFMPIIKSLSESAGSLPGETSKKLGSFLVFTVLQVSNFSSNLFLTAAAQNLLCLDLAAQAGVAVSSPWMTWFIAAAPPCLLGMLVTPLIMYKARPPRVCALCYGIVDRTSPLAPLACPLCLPHRLFSSGVPVSCASRSLLRPPAPRRVDFPAQHHCSRTALERALPRPCCWRSLIRSGGTKKAHPRVLQGTRRIFATCAR